MPPADKGKLTVVEIKERLVITDEEFEHFLPILLLPVYSVGLLNELYKAEFPDFGPAELIIMLRKLREAGYTYGASIETPSEEIAFSYPGEGVRYAVIRNLSKDDILDELEGIVAILSTKLTNTNFDRALIEYARYLSIAIMQSDEIPETVVADFDKRIRNSNSGLDQQINSESLQIISLILNRISR